MSLAVPGRTMLGCWRSFSHMSPSDSEPLGSRNATWFWKAWTPNPRPEHEPFQKINFLPCTKNVFQLCHCTSVIVIHVTVAQKTLLYLIALPCQNMCIRPTELTATRMQYVAALSCYVKDFTFRHHKKIPWKAIRINQLAFKSLFNMWMRTYVNMPHCKDLDSEIAALGYTMRKLWSGLRALWRNSPDTSSSDVIQALKNEMLKKPGPGPCQTAEDTSVLQTVNDLWSLEGDKTGWSGGNTKEDHSHQHK